MQKKILVASAIALGLAGIWGVDAHGAQTQLSIIPLFKLSSRFDSNFYKTDSDEIEAWTYLVQPGFQAEVETERSHASLGYTLDANYYSGLDEDLDFIGHTFNLDTGTRSKSGKLRVNLQDTFSRTRDASQGDTLGNSVSTEKFSINRFDPEILYRLGLSTFKLGYGNVWIDYSDRVGADSVENRGIAEWKYQFNRANALGLNYQFWTLDDDSPNGDYDSRQATLVYARQSRSLLFKAGAGWQTREFDAPALGDLDLFVWDFMLQWKRPGHTELTLLADHNFNNSSTGTGYYDATRVALAISHNIAEDLLGGLKVSFQRSDYEFINREDDTWNLGASLEYTLTTWLTLIGTAGYETRDSSLDSGDYDNIYGSAMLTFAFPIGKARS